jgi:hypothetical protein
LKQKPNAKVLVPRRGKLTAKESRTIETTYIPGEGDPLSVEWHGHTFHANVPEQVSHVKLIEAARNNKFFKVGEFYPNTDQVENQPQATKLSPSRPSRERTQLSLSDVDVILDSIDPKLTKQKRLRLLSDINGALDLYAFEISNENQDTLNQFRIKFNSLLESLKRLRINLPSPSDRLWRRSGHP